MARIILFNKPFRVLSQFSDSWGRATLSHYLDVPGYRVAGRLDYESEGLLLLTDDGRLQQRIANPRHKPPKIYLAQVEGTPDGAALRRLERGVTLRDGPTRPAGARIIEAPALWPRQPPVRHRAHVPSTWLELTLREGRNRQVRRMTAAVGYPTLRLVRIAVGDWALDALAPGEWREVAVHLPVRQRPAGPAAAP